MLNSNLPRLEVHFHTRPPMGQNSIGIIDALKLQSTPNGGQSNPSSIQAPTAQPNAERESQRIHPNRRPGLFSMRPKKKKKETTRHPSHSSHKTINRSNGHVPHASIIYQRPQPIDTRDGLLQPLQSTAFLNISTLQHRDPLFQFGAGLALLRDHFVRLAE